MGGNFRSLKTLIHYSQELPDLISNPYDGIFKYMFLLNDGWTSWRVGVDMFLTRLLS